MLFDISNHGPTQVLLIRVAINKIGQINVKNVASIKARATSFTFCLGIEVIIILYFRDGQLKETREPYNKIKKYIRAKSKKKKRFLTIVIHKISKN